MLSTGVENLAASVMALQEKLRAAEFELVHLRREQLLNQVEQFIAESETLPGGVRLIARFVEADAMLLRDLASKLIETPSVIALLGAMNGDQAIYVFGRAADVNMHMGTLLKESALSFGGKGGGRPDFAQGGGCREILEAARKALTNA